MFVKFSIFVCFMIQGLSAQCIGAYNGLAAESWPAANGLAWERNSAWPASNILSWEAAGPFGTGNPCAGTEFAAATAAGSWPAAPFAAAEWGQGYSAANLAASNGAGLAITSGSPIAPIGVSMNSENIYEGPLAVAGAMPFLGAVALEGALPTGGAGAVAYSSGNGNVAMINEDYAAGYGVGPLGYGAGITSPAYGYNGFSGPVTMEAGIAGPAFAYNGISGIRAGGCGCGSNVYSQCIGAAGPFAAGYDLRYGATASPEFIAPGLAPYPAVLAPIEALGAYGGAGIGDMAVAGEMLVAGTTLVAGQVPILGAVRFAGDLQASGTVSISGSCGCGGGAYMY